jgi:hypothetical protein
LDFAIHQKSPGQQSTDSGFSGEGKNPPGEGGFGCLSDYETGTGSYNGEELSQLVDQVLSSIDVQFPEEIAAVDMQEQEFRIPQPRCVYKKVTYGVTNQYLKKFSYGFWDNQFGRNQRYLKLKLGAPQFMPGIKNLNLIFV